MNWFNFACYNENEDEAKLILANGADINATSVLDYAIKNRFLTLVNWLNTKGEIAFQNVQL
ncbi:MAG: ankyrin repeat domain-containing protein [Flavobacteriales bacterium]|nr:ankyrin repeat domain-containing protein [Flavobacteriales bacterium]